MARQSAHQGQEILRIIASSGLSIEATADMVGVTRRTIYLWCKDEVVPDYKIDRIGNAIGIDLRATSPGVFGPGKPIKPRQISDSDNAERVVEFWKEKYQASVEQLNQQKERENLLVQQLNSVKAELYDLQKAPK